MGEIFQPSAIIATLARHRVRYVLVGGLAAAIHGSPTTTTDADLCPDRSASNLIALAAALREMDARIRTDAVDGGLPFACDAEFLARMDVTLNLVTKFGDVDLTLRPAAFHNGFDDLLPRAVEVSVDGGTVMLASLDDIITSKRAANRPKDRAVLPILEALRDEIEDRERPPG